MVSEGMPTWSFIATAKVGDDVAHAFVWCSPAGYTHPEVRARCESQTLDRLRQDHPTATDVETRWVFTVLREEENDRA